MNPKHLKTAVSAVSIFAAAVISTVADLSWAQTAAVAAVGLIPPVVIFVLWKDPALTMSESIDVARR